MSEEKFARLDYKSLSELTNESISWLKAELTKKQSNNEDSLINMSDEYLKLYT
jgi:hypothetical protein